MAADWDGPAVGVMSTVMTASHVMTGGEATGVPTKRQVEVLRAYIASGSIAGAAHRLGIAESTARQHLSALYQRTGWLNAAQAAYRLGSADARTQSSPGKYQRQGKPPA